MSDRPLNPLLEITSRLEPRLFIDAVLTRWQVIALCLVVCPSFALLFAFLAPANYSASATVRIQSNVSLNALLDQGPQADWELNSKIPVVLEVLNSRPVARSILFELGEIGPQATPREIDLAIEVFHSQLRVFPLAGGIVEIQFQSKDPDKVVRCIRLLMAALREAMVRPQVESLDASVEFLRDQLERIRQELSENETEMQDFLGQSDSQRPEVYEAALDHYSSLLGDYSSAQSDLVAAEQALEISRGRLASYDPRRAELDRQLSSARGALDSLSRTYTDDHPEVVRARNRVAAVERERNDYMANPDNFEIEDIERILASRRSDEVIQEELSAYREALTEVEGLRQRVELMRSQIDDTLASLTTFAASAQTIANMQRDAEAKSTVYTRLMAQFEEAQVNRELTVHEEERQVWVIEQPDEQDPPERKKIGLKIALVGGVFAGLLLSFVAVAVGEFFEKTVRLASEAGHVANAPVIGVLPPMSGQA
ncbi:MAG: hypothetical protein H6700_06035 [Myxococcales bacterium]|nr:hypothetical protein [Myxococcales bacterium]MCB9531305.1 hypothetical protein [Myxococcales bacterium]